MWWKMIKREIRWVKQAKAGDRQALNKLLKRYYESIYLLAYSYVKNEADALDVIQEAAYKAVLRLEQLRQEEYFSTWLNRIVINEAKYLLAKKGKAQLRQISEEGLLEQLPEVRQPVEQDEELMRELRMLNEKYEEVLLLFYFNDLSVKEIAELTDSSENTVKTRLSRGRAILRRRLLATGYERRG